MNSYQVDTIVAVISTGAPKAYLKPSSRPERGRRGVEGPAVDLTFDLHPLPLASTCRHPDRSHSPKLPSSRPEARSAVAERPAVDLAFDLHPAATASTCRHLDRKHSLT